VNQFTAKAWRPVLVGRL